MLIKKSLIVLLLAGLVIFTVNSCKKNDQDTLNHYLTISPWQLASVQVFTYVGATLVETDTLNTACNVKQTFTFKTDQSCGYKNFICRVDSAKGGWTLSDDKLLLHADMLCKDTVTGGRDTTDAPFKNAQIVNLGGYSLVLQTGDVNTYYTTTQKRVIKKWGFIHQ